LNTFLICIKTQNTFVVFQHAPGIPKVLVGNRLHFEFRRQVDQGEAEEYAQKNFMGFFEVSPLVNFNISESFTELARMALKRNGMERLWRSNKGDHFSILNHSFCFFLLIFNIENYSVIVVRNMCPCNRQQNRSLWHSQATTP
jgi:hypothetical protein